MSNVSNNLWNGISVFQIAQLQKDSNSGLGISLEGTVDVEDGREVRPHHYIRNILPDGPVGNNGFLQSGDELLEVCKNKYVVFMQIHLPIIAEIS